MSNDPDLIYKLHGCHTCEGEGGWFEDSGDEYGSISITCPDCDGSGEVAR